MLFSASRADEFAHTQNIGWRCFILGQGEDIEEIATAQSNLCQDLQLRLRGGQFALYGRLQLSVLFHVQTSCRLGRCSVFKC